MVQVCVLFIYYLVLTLASVVHLCVVEGVAAIVSSQGVVMLVLAGARRCGYPMRFTGVLVPLAQDSMG